MAFWYGSATDAFIYPYQPDSSYYIERARILLGSGVLHPDRLFPPGYPLLITAAAAVGLEPANAALWLVRVGYALLPVLLAWALKGVTGTRSAVTIAVLVVLSPGLWYIGAKAGSDMPFLALTIAAFALLLSSAASFNPVEALASGVLLGAAYAIRNAGVAAFAAVAVTLGVGALYRWFPRERAFAIAGSFALGAALPVVPLLLWNYVELGYLQPYSMPPSNIALVTNIRVFAEQTVLDLVASDRIAKYVGWDYRFLLGVGVGLAGLLIAGIKSQWPNLENRQRFALVLLGSYAAAGASMVVLARTLYEWGESINLRHVAQYGWAMFAAAALLLDSSRRRGALAKPTRAVVAVAVMVLIIARTAYLSAEYHRNGAMYRALVAASNPVAAIAVVHDSSWIWTGALKRGIADDRKLMAAIRMIPAETVVTSNLADVLRIETGRAVPMLEFNSANQMADQLAKLRSTARSGSPVDALIFPTNSTLRNGQWLALLALPTVVGYEVVTAGPELLWLRSD